MSGWFTTHIVHTGRLPLFCFFVAFLASFGFIRVSVRMIRAQVRWWPGNVTHGDTHLHHMVSGVVFMVIAGVALAPAEGVFFSVIAVVFLAATIHTLRSVTTTRPSREPVRRDHFRRHTALSTRLAASAVRRAGL